MGCFFRAGSGGEGRIVQCKLSASEMSRKRGGREQRTGDEGPGRAHKKTPHRPSHCGVDPLDHYGLVSVFSVVVFVSLLGVVSTFRSTVVFDVPSGVVVVTSAFFCTFPFSAQ